MFLFLVVKIIYEDEEKIHKTICLVIFRVLFFSLIMEVPRIFGHKCDLNLKKINRPEFFPHFLSYRPDFSPN